MFEAKKQILVVDDQPGIRRLLLDVLTEEGYDVTVAGNGNDALENLLNFRPKIILMDMKMPGMDGVEVLEEIRKMQIPAKVIMMTAYGEAEKVNKAKNLGAYAYITKPFDIIKLCDFIAEAMDKPDEEFKVI